MNENLELLPAIKEEPDIKKELDIKEIPGVMQEPGVKKEPIKCDCMIPSRKEDREILMEFSRNRKKIIYLNGSKTLFGEYNKLLVSDPSLSDLLFCAYPIFQEFNPKFKTWVDIDHEENLIDGAVVKVRFFFKRTESDGSYPGSIKRKRDDFDIEPNPKQRRVHQDDYENDLDLWSKCLDINEIENVDPERRANILSSGIRKCRSVNRPRGHYSRNAVSVRKNLFPRFRSNSLDRWGSDRKPDQVVPPSAGSEKKQWYLMPEEINTNTQVTSTDVQPHSEAALSHSEPLHPSYAVEQTTGAVLSGRQINVTPSQVQPLRVEENQCANSPQSRCAVNAPGTCTTPAKIHTSFFEAKGTGNFPQKYAPKPEVFGRSIRWTYLPKGMKPRRLAWGQQNLEKIWWNTVFSDVALFGLEGNCIKYYETSDLSKIESELFWVFRTFDGPNIMVPLGFSLRGSNLAKMLRNEVIGSMKEHYRTGDVTLQFLRSLKTQFDSKIVRDELAINSIAVSEWPTSAKDLSPIYHACKLIGEKVKNIPCTSKQEMFSILSGMWEKDSDVQMMCSKIIKLLPQIIKSVVGRNGNSPRTNVEYVITK